MTEQQIASRLNIKLGEVVPSSGELVRQIKLLVDETISDVAKRVESLKIKAGDNLDFELTDDPQDNCYYAYNCAVHDVLRLLERGDE